jgi:hypothetical protein
MWKDGCCLSLLNAVGPAFNVPPYRGHLRIVRYRCKLCTILNDTQNGIAARM